MTLTPEDLGAASAESVSQLKNDLSAEQTARVEGLAEKLGKTETAANSAKLGGKAPEYYIQPMNLLDNSDFRNPVNQRGITTFSETSGYWLDRWVETRCSIDLTANTASVAEGTENNGYFYQRMPQIGDGKEVVLQPPHYCSKLHGVV